MSLLKQYFVAPNDPVLIKIAQEVDNPQSPVIKKAIEHMLSVAYGNRKDTSKPTVVGLAAPQIGISQRIIAVDVGAEKHGRISDLRIYINPEIIEKSVSLEEWCEGCWSTERVCGAVSRPKSVTIKAYTPEGNIITEKYSGYVARIFQHEIDHLNGKEFVSHIVDDAKLHWVEEDQWLEYKQNEGWRNWKYKCPREKWYKIKGIKMQ